MRRRVADGTMRYVLRWTALDERVSPMCMYRWCCSRRSVSFSVCTSRDDADMRAHVLLLSASEGDCRSLGVPAASARIARALSSLAESLEQAAAGVPGVRALW